MKIKLLLLSLLLIAGGFNLHGSFNTLSDLTRYADYHYEYPKSDNNDWIDPDYTSFYKKIYHPSLLQNIVNGIKKFFGFSSVPKWDSEQFKTLLKEVTKRRGKKLLRTIERTISLDTGSRCFVWGDLHGAFHSLVRDLQELKNKDVIDENLKIIKENTHFVMLGDAVSRSPYSLETLHTILLLMHRNPNKVIYLRGNHERRSHWEGFGMRRAIKAHFKAWKESVVKDVPLIKEINSFFAVLHDILFIEHKGNGEKACCASSGFAKKLMLDNNIVLLLQGEARVDTLQDRRGLTFMGHLGNFAQWSLISCPTEVYQQFFKFHYDSFVELKIGPSIASSVLALHDRDVKNARKFGEKFYNPVFGYPLKEAKNDLTNKTIVKVGCTASLTGIIGPLGRETRNGMESAFCLYNKEENDVLIKPIFLDDGYVPRRAMKNIKRLHESYGVDLILTPTGTPTLLFYLDKVKNKDVAVLFPYTGGAQFRQKDISGIVHFRASYAQEVEKIIDYLVAEYGIRKFAFFYQDDPYGYPIAMAAHEELKKYGITKWLDIQHLRVQSDFADEIKKIKEFMPEAIGCFTTHFPASEIISQLGTDFFWGKILFGVSFLYSDAFKTFLRERGIRMVASSVVPDPQVNQSQVSIEHRKAMEKFGRYPSTNSLEGYISASLFIDAISKVTPPITKEKVIAHFEGMEEYPFKGMSLTFDPEKRQLYQAVWIKTMDNKWIRS
jgi:ABC-type branched-subunit amino acid transport system substrate-binding protein